MKRMTNIELNSRIAQFIERKKESFPDIFEKSEVPQPFKGPLSGPNLLAGHGFSGRRPRYS